MSPDFKNENEIKDNGGEWFLPPDSVRQLKELFTNLQGDVHLEVYTREGYNDSFNDFCRKFTADLARLSPRITVSLHELGSARAEARGVERSPTILIEPERYNIRYTGAPVGEEGRSFLTTLLHVSLGKTGLSEFSEHLLAKLEEPRDVKVFVTAACPYCPGQVLNAVKAAVARPELVSVDCVEINEHRDLADRYGVGSVPQTNFADGFGQLGLMPEERFMLELVTLKDADEVLRSGGLEKLVGAEAAAILQAGEPGEYDVVVVGAGPGGLTAAIYTERAGLSTVVLEKGIIGGQVAVTPVVENYPGFAGVPGKQLMDIMGQHARQYCDIREGEGVSAITRLEDGRFELTTDRGAYTARAVILSTGADYRKLGAPGEDEYFGRGVNYCASCDGYLYKSRRVVVVGGGNTALTDALYMKNLGIDVTIVHRRDSFRAEKHLQDSVEREGIPVVWDAEVTSLNGDGAKLTSLTLKGKDGTTSELETDGVFVAIGHVPHNELAGPLGVALGEGGWILADRAMRTSEERVYACGDVTGGVQQIVTAVGEGSTAAISAFEDLSKQG
jgi:thioredoxin reductase (NADPH)